ncbi:TonB-dependent receptor [Lacimicrobium sp. SS2-24]|uniref:TonB-dependent receptor plug domain-containing protein n=1 Tax=Lacimicrobium sp. SS2-24 TaxID=2005569 RepID=UPI00143A8F41|nr:TonB-dependent receptor [Lacimicrobium sp. SS2-24]
MSAAPLYAQDKDLFSMSIDELMNIEVVSASNMKERLIDAPATIIVISKEDIRQRGYLELSEIFDDLPGMDVTRPYGDNYFKNFMRGYRNTIGSPYLVMVDGVTMNTMYFGIETPMVTVPLTNIEQVEVVYGPASSVYGANAFMGVVNIITQRHKGLDGSRFSGSVTKGTDGFDITEATYAYGENDWRFMLSARIESGDLADRIDANSFYWLRDELYASTDLWGGFAEQLSDGFSSYIENRGLDLRLYYGNTEFAWQYWLLDSGYGSVYPGDRILSNGVWPREQYGGYIRHQMALTSNIDSTTLLRYRHDGVPNHTFDIEAWNETNATDDILEVGRVALAPGETARMLHLTYWQSLNDGWSLFQDFDIQLSDSFDIKTGLKYEYKDLQKAYDLTTTTIAPELADPDDLTQYPEQSDITKDDWNRITWHDVGIYMQTKWAVSETHSLNLGARYDRNNQYGSEVTIRGGYIGHFDRFTAKLLYGEAFQEPVPRSLYGAWTGSGSDPDLKPEKSNTIEIALNYTGDVLNHHLNIYRVNNTETVINFTGGARNVGQRTVEGADYSVTSLVDVSWAQQLKVWGYASFILTQEEEKYDTETGDYLGAGIIGDLARQKYYLGLTAEFSNDVDFTVRSRYISDKETVDTNPVRHVPGYFVLDANVNFNNIWTEGLSLSLRLNNLFDKNYYHPGVREANSGDPGQDPSLLDTIGFSGINNRAWSGSSGWYNSLLPQPERRLQLTLSYQY